MEVLAHKETSSIRCIREINGVLAAHFWSGPWTKSGHNLHIMWNITRDTCAVLLFLYSLPTSWFRIVVLLSTDAAPYKLRNLVFGACRVCLKPSRLVCVMFPCWNYPVCYPGDWQNISTCWLQKCQYNRKVIDNKILIFNWITRVGYFIVVAV